MTTSFYPPGLPGPNSASIVPAERRQFSALDSVRIARVLQADRLGTQTLSFRFTSSEMAIFTAWWRDLLIYGSQWFGATWPAPQGGVVQRRFIGEPRRTLLIGVGWDVSAVVEMRGAGMPQESAVDPYFGNVVSLLDFHQAITPLVYTGSYPHEATTPVTEDYKGVVWTMYGHEFSAPTIGGGTMRLPPYQQDGPFSQAELVSAVTPSFAAAGDFTLEFTHDDAGDAIYGLGSNMVVVSGAPTASNSPTAVGEWQFTVPYASGVNGIVPTFLIQRALSGTDKLRTVATSPVTVSGQPQTVPAGVRRQYAICRAAGRLSLFIDGKLRAIQPGSQAADFTPLCPQVTFGAYGTGNYYLPNNYGTGKFSRWRFTVGVARYSADYATSALPFPTR